jgi:glycosidase
MQWQNQPNAGFSSGEPWLPVHADYPDRNVEQQMTDPNSLLNFIKIIIQIRKAEPALQRGDFQPLTEDPHQILAYYRTLQDDQVLVVLNFSIRELIFDLPGGNWRSLLDEETQTNGFIALKPYDVRLFKKIKEPETKAG